MPAASATTVSDMRYFVCLTWQPCIRCTRLCTAVAWLRASKEERWIRRVHRINQNTTSISRFRYFPRLCIHSRQVSRARDPGFGLPWNLFPTTFVTPINVPGKCRYSVSICIFKHVLGTTRTADENWFIVPICEITIGELIVGPLFVVCPQIFVDILLLYP